MKYTESQLATHGKVILAYIKDKSTPIEEFNEEAYAWEDSNKPMFYTSTKYRVKLTNQEDIDYRAIEEILDGTFDVSISLAEEMRSLGIRVTKERLGIAEKSLEETGETDHCFAKFKNEDIHKDLHLSRHKYFGVNSDDKSLENEDDEDRADIMSKLLDLGRSDRESGTNHIDNLTDTLFPIKEEQKERQNKRQDKRLEENELMLEGVYEGPLEVTYTASQILAHGELINKCIKEPNTIIEKFDEDTDEWTLCFDTLHQFRWDTQYREYQAPMFINKLGETFTQQDIDEGLTTYYYELTTKSIKSFELSSAEDLEKEDSRLFGEISKSEIGAMELGIKAIKSIDKIPQ